MIKILLKYLALLIIFSPSVYSQAQHKIEWPSLADSPWPILTGDAQSTGRSEFVGPKTSDAQVIWTADLPFGILFGPTIGYDNILYFGTSEVDPNHQNPFYAYYPDGNQFWQYQTNSWIANTTSALITKDSTVYMRTNAGDIYAFTLSGTVKWITNVGYGFRLQLSIDKLGNIYTYVQDTLIVVNPNGDKILSKYFEGITAPIVFSPDGNTIYFKKGYIWSPEDNFIIAADLMGDSLWSYRLNDVNAASVVVDNEGNLYFYGIQDSLGYLRSYLFALKPNGELKWKFPNCGGHYSTAPSIDKDGNIVFYCNKSGGISTFNYIVSLNYDGEVNWEYPLEPNEEPYFAQVDHGLVCDAEGNIYFGSLQGNYFYALNKFGELLWKIPLNGHDYSSSPAIGSDGTLYIGTTSSDSSIENLIAIRDYPNSVDNGNVISDFKLYQNYPNPFNPNTNIKYSILSRQFVSIIIYDVLGNEITTLVNEEKPAGTYNLTWNAESVAGILPSGVYFYRLKAGEYIETRKMIFMK